MSNRFSSELKIDAVLTSMEPYQVQATLIDQRNIFSESDIAQGMAFIDRAGNRYSINSVDSLEPLHLTLYYSDFNAPIMPVCGSGIIGEVSPDLLIQ
jgi:hypothetical protein